MSSIPKCNELEDGLNGVTNPGSGSVFSDSAKKWTRKGTLVDRVSPRHPTPAA